MEQAVVLTQILQNVAVALAVAIGGIWVLFRWFILREDLEALDCTVETTQSTHSSNGMFFLTLIFRLKNVGPRALKLAPDGVEPFNKPLASREAGTRYQKVAYRNCEFKLWKLDDHATTVDSLVSLFDKASPVPEVKLADYPVNLLAEANYTPRSYWLEAHEIDQASMTLCLSPGYYIGSLRILINKRAAVRVYTRRRYSFFVFSFPFEVATTN